MKLLLKLFSLLVLLGGILYLVGNRTETVVDEEDGDLLGI
jgi:hypothetical protein